MKFDEIFDSLDEIINQKREKVPQIEITKEVVSGQVTVERQAYDFINLAFYHPIHGTTLPTFDTIEEAEEQLKTALELLERLKEMI
jgi:hypothetical protein